MKRCKNCKRQYKDKAKYCVFCGIPLAQSNDEVVPGAKNFSVSISYKMDSVESKNVYIKFPAIMGRDSSSVDIPILHPSVSRKHCRLSVQGGTLIIEDLGASNGTFVNGQRISAPTPITNDDEIMIGKLKVGIRID